MLDARPPETIPALLERLARTRPQAPLLFQRQAGGRWRGKPARRVWSEVQAVSRGLRLLGLRPGERLALLARPSEEWQIADWAGMAAGAVIVGLEPHTPAETLARRLERAQVHALVAEDRASLEQMPARLLRKLTFIVLFSDSMEQEPHGAAAEGVPVVSWRSLLCLRALGRSECPALCRPQDAAALFFTSGASGEPKGIEYSHRQLLQACRSIAHALPVLGPRDRGLCWLPLAHMFQRIINLMALIKGARIYFVDDPRTLPERIREVEPTVFVGVPRFYEKLHHGLQERLAALSGWRKRLVQAALRSGGESARAARQGRTLPWTARLRHAVYDRLVLRRLRACLGPRLKFMLTGSAPAAPWLLEFFHALGWLPLEAYGLSENAVPMAMNRPGAFRFGSVGRPLAENELRFAPDGEILVKGPGVFRGYDRERPAQEELFTADGFFRTGDLGRLDEDGFLHLTGRKREVFKTSTGRTLAPAPLEALYRRCPLVDHVVVYGHGRPGPAALCTLHRAAVLAELARQGGPVDERALAASPRVRKLIREAFARLDEGLSPHARVRDVAILSAPLRIETGELTATLKLNRARIETLHREELEALFRDASAPATRGDSAWPPSGSLRARPAQRIDPALEQACPGFVEAAGA